MTGYVSETLVRLEQREAEREARVAAARRMYVESCLGAEASGGGADELVTAMDELGLGAADLKNDALVGTAFRRFERELATAHANLRNAQAGLAKSEEDLGKLRFDDPAIPQFRRQCARAEDAVDACKRVVEVIHLSMKSCIQRAPRVFALRPFPLPTSPKAAVPEPQGAVCNLLP
jgi:hypothetical protein